MLIVDKNIKLAINGLLTRLENIRSCSVSTKYTLFDLTERERVRSSSRLIYAKKSEWAHTQLARSVGDRDLLAAAPRGPAALVRRVVILRARAVRLLLRGGRRGAVDGAVLEARREARRVVLRVRVRQGPDAHLRRAVRAADARARAQARVLVVVRVRHLLLERRRVRRLRLVDLHEAVVLVRLRVTRAE